MESFIQLVKRSMTAKRKNKFPYIIPISFERFCYFSVSLPTISSFCFNSTFMFFCRICFVFLLCIWNRNVSSESCFSRTKLNHSLELDVLSSLFCCSRSKKCMCQFSVPRFINQRFFFTFVGGFVYSSCRRVGFLSQRLECLF